MTQKDKVKPNILTDIQRKEREEQWKADVTDRFNSGFFARRAEIVLSLSLLQLEAEKLVKSIKQIKISEDDMRKHSRFSCGKDVERFSERVTKLTEDLKELK